MIARWTSVSLFFVLLAGCGSAPPPKPAGPVAEIDFGECRFSVPADPGWTSEVDKVKGTSVFIKIDHPTLKNSRKTTIQVRRHLVEEGRLQLSAAQQIQAVFVPEERQLVENSEGGVKYWVRGLQKGVKTVAEKEFHFMRYQTGRTARVGPGQEAYLSQTTLYLHFPVHFATHHVFYSFRVEEHNPLQRNEPTFGADQLDPVVASLRMI